MGVLLVAMVVFGIAAAIVGLKRGGDRREIIGLCIVTLATTLVLLPDVVPGSRGAARVASVLLLVGVVGMGIWRHRR